MAILLQNPIYTIATVTLSLVALVYAYFKWKYQYWAKRNIPFLEPIFPLGTARNPFDSSVSDADKLLEEYGILKQRNLKYCGLYMLAKPIFLVKDLEYIKRILLKDFDYFNDRYFYVNEKDDPIGAHLFALGGDKWKSLRTKLTPTFSSGKMKSMFPILVDVGKVMETFMSKLLEENQPINIKDVSSCYTTDIIGSCAFGLECNSFKEPDSLFRKFGNKIFNFPSILNELRMLFAFTFPNLGRKLGLRQIDKETSDFYFKIVQETVSYREANNVVRKDFLQLLIDLKNENVINMKELVAQCFVFFAAGFETSSTTMTFALFELSRNPDIQNKLREEIKSVLKKHNGITYDAVMDMKYMDQVISETLRKYPPLPFITRAAVKDYKIPEENIVLEKDTFIMFPIIGIHYDEEYYENPNEFIPDRFSPENKNKIPQFAYMPFGEGPRLCIGMRFGLMQTKVGLICLLRNYKFSLNERTKLPIKMNAKSFTLSIKGDLWLNVEKV